MINIKDDPKLSILNHSCAHLMAQAIKHLYKDAMFWVGPVINEGFYYDIDIGDQVIKEEDLLKIEKEMKKIAKDGKLIIREELSKQQALEMFSNDKYKIDLINNMDEDSTIISCYRQGDFVDLCRGPHVNSVKEIKYFKLLKVSGAYWKGDAKNKMLQRIYGIAFYCEEDLNNHLYLLEEAKKRDHRKLGKELELISFSEYGPGLPFFLHNGMIIRNILQDYWYQQHELEGYTFINTPLLLSKELWEVSGHWQNYKDNMYLSSIEDKEFAIKPMNCPGCMLVYKNGLHSYKDLPIRIGELGLVHRHEASGALSGLFRVRSFTQDDAHIFMTSDQIESEIIRLIKFIDRIYSIFNFSYDIELSTRPLDKFIGDISVWDKSEQALANACIKANKEYKINENDGAFYGPKLDFKIKDSLGRTWQCATIQLDMNLPERFDLNYIDHNGNKVRPIMLHRVIYGSIERFIGILIEHYGGAFPLWLAPIQVIIIPVFYEKHNEYSNKLLDIFKENNIRVKLDDRNEKLGYRIRDAQTKKIPIQLVIGDNEIESNMLNLRRYNSKDTISIDINSCITMLKKEIYTKK